MVTTGKCICQLCTCGRHQCPHNRGTIGKQTTQASCQLTEYQFSYPENRPFTSPTKSMKPPPREHTINVPLETESTHMRTYTKHSDTQPRASMKVKTEFKAPGEPMEDTTSYKDDYKHKVGERTKMYYPENNLLLDKSKFQMKSMYRTSYKNHDPADWTWCRTKPIKHRECIKTGDSCKFAGTTTMKEDYKLHSMPERVKITVPVTETTISKDKFENTTTYKQEYVKKASDYEPSAKPNYRPNTATFFGESTMRSAFKPITDGMRAKSFKPNEDYHPASEKFMGNTTVTDTFKKWAAIRPETPAWAKRKSYVPPKITFGNVTSYQDAYKAPTTLAISRSPLPQPKLDLSNSGDNVVMRTMYQSQFVPYENSAPSKSFMKVTNYEVPKVKMQGKSEYQNKYTGEMTQKAASCTPASNYVKSDGKNNEYNTTYRNTFKGDQSGDCPANDIVLDRKGSDMALTSKSSYMEFDKNRNGHYFFKPINIDGSTCKSATTRNTTNPNSTENIQERIHSAK